MADSGYSRGSLRLPRVRPGAGVSRNSSMRSSGNPNDECRLPSGTPAGVHALRAASSRFSLNEQFASTRQEYELWDDDASSVYEQVTNASEVGDPDNRDKILVSSTEDSVLLFHADNIAPGPDSRDWDYYDLLCLDRSSHDLSQDDIRNAYYRLFLLFYPDSYPEHLRPIARQQFLRAQQAFETLISPTRRAQYDLDEYLQSDDNRETASAYDAAFKEAVRDRIQSGVQTSSDLGVRLSASTSRDSHTGDSGSRLVDFALSHSVAVDLPTLRDALQPQVARLERLISPQEPDAIELSLPRVEVGTPTITISGSVYGTPRDITSLPIGLLYDRYQPLMPLTIPRSRLVQLVQNRLAPLITLRYRQEFLNPTLVSPLDTTRWIKTAVEVESDILPEFSATSRVYHHIALPNSSQPTIIEATVQSSRHASDMIPRVALGIHHDLFNGTAFLRADSGDWDFGSSNFCRSLAKFSRISANGMSSIGSPLKTASSLELGFRTASSQRVPPPGSSDSPSGECGIRGLDSETSHCKEGTWAVSAAATCASVAGFVRYSKDLVLPFLSSKSSTPEMSLARLEVELCSNTFQDRHLALRNLFSVGRFAKLGLEVGISLHSLHLSVYWSRLGQRINIPLLIAPSEPVGAGILFWAGALPFASLAAVQLGLGHRRRRRRRRRRHSRRHASSDLPMTEARVTVARQRYEADNVAVLLAQSVEANQKRQMSLGGLVILSAKLGVPDEEGSLATGEQVADVTIALAALLNNSADTPGQTLHIPHGVRKTRLIGFWDPAPNLDKVLRVEYSFKGVEAVIEVGEQVELTLPPPT